MSDLLDRKLRHFFTLMDRDGSDTVNSNDYLTIADSVGRVFGLPAGSPEHDELRRVFTRFWEDIIKPMDTDGNGHVSFDEYLTAYNAGVVTTPRATNRSGPSRTRSSTSPTSSRTERSQRTTSRSPSPATAYPSRRAGPRSPRSTRTGAGS